jgi:hypothetical protein
MDDPKKHFDTSGKSPAQFHQRALLCFATLNLPLHIRSGENPDASDNANAACRQNRALNSN